MKLLFFLLRQVDPKQMIVSLRYFRRFKDNLRHFGAEVNLSKIKSVDMM